MNRRRNTKNGNTDEDVELGMKKSMRSLSRRLAVIIAVAISLTLVIPVEAGAAFVGEREISSQSAIVIDCETGVMLYGHRETAQRVPASITKLMAAYVIYDAARAGEIRLDSTTRISRSTSSFSYNLGYSNVPLLEGMSVSINRLMEVVLIRSACAATVAMGEALCGSERAFVARMNEKAAQLGIEARFYDSYGGSPDNRISALGLAELSRTLINEFPEILRITSRSTVTFNGITYNSSNLLLGQYPGLDGLKTGYTDPAGYCFVGTALRNGRRIIAVTLGSTLERRYPDTRILLDHGFAVADDVIAEYFRVDTADPSNASLVVDDVTTPLTAYIIDGFHYFKLRDIAYLLRDTEKQFEVTWSSENRSASITSGLPYTVGGSELTAVEGARPYLPTTSGILFNGAEREFEVYLIDNFNYFKLRDLSDLLDFNVHWVGETRTVIINTRGDSGVAPPVGEARGDLVGLFSRVITELLGNDLSLDSGIVTLAIDLIEVDVLSEAEKNALLRTLEDRHGVRAIRAAIDELYEQGLIGTGDFYFRTGILFTFTNLEFTGENRLVFSVSKWRSLSEVNLFIDFVADRSADGAWTFSIGE